MNQKPLLILDLDETLIHATVTKIRDNFDFQLYQYFVYQRPGLAEFLAQCAVHFQLAVWLSASDDYVRAVASRLFPAGLTPVFVWAVRAAPGFACLNWTNTGF